MCSINGTIVKLSYFNVYAIVIVLSSIDWEIFQSTLIAGEFDRIMDLFAALLKYKVEFEFRL